MDSSSRYRKSSSKGVAVESGEGEESVWTAAAQEVPSSVMLTV